MSLPEETQPERHDDVVEQGDHQGKRDVVTGPGAPLDSAGAWRIKAVQMPLPEPPAESKAEPGDFTRMFELRQAPEPAPLPVSKPVPAAPASQPGEFTRAFQRPSAKPLSGPEGVSAPGQAGEFTRMFQTPAPAAAKAIPEVVPQPPVTVSHPSESGADVPLAPARNRTLFIAGAILLLCALAVFVLMRRIY